MAYDAEKPVTVSNCPTRAALERPAVLKESIGAKHSRAKADRHQQNVADRAMHSANRHSRTVKVKVSK